MRYTGQHLSRLATCYYARFAGLLEHIQEYVRNYASRDSNPYEIAPVDIPIVSGMDGQLREHWTWNRFLGDSGRKWFTSGEILADSRRERLIPDVIVTNSKTASL